jgi:tetratricopeptide (TPR) repeat protein
MTRGELEDERTFLLRSLEDLDREHEAGDLSDEDHATLRDGYVARTAEVLRSLDGSASSDPASAVVTMERPVADGPPVGQRRRRRRTRYIVSGSVAVVIVAAFLSVVVHVGPRLPGESLSGSITLTPAQQVAQNLADAETLEDQGNAAGAVQMYGTVLRQDPNQEQALAEVGWLEYQAGAQARASHLLSLGQEEEQRAATLDPGDYAPHLYLGTMLLAEGKPEQAVTQYQHFLADHPAQAQVRAAAPFIDKAFSQAHLPPPSLPVGATTSTTG